VLASFSHFLIQRFVDRDMLMRYHVGLGVGHQYAHNEQHQPPAQENPADATNPTNSGHIQKPTVENSAFADHAMESSKDDDADEIPEEDGDESSVRASDDNDSTAGDDNRSSEAEGDTDDDEVLARHEMYGYQ
jgi:hypothetical protein